MTAPLFQTSPSLAAPVEPPAGRYPTPEIDASCRWPVLFLFAKAICWLLLGSFLAVVVAVKLHAPGLLADIAWLTVGRLRPAAINVLLYGFAFQAGLGVVLWLICRLGGVPLLNRPLILFATLLWNIGVLLGLVSILAGGTTGFQWLEMPAWIAFILFASYALIGLWALITFHYRRVRPLYVSQWYLVGALFWFPWIYSAANYLLLGEPVRGVMQAVVNAWYTQNLLDLFFAPIGLAVIYYFLPKLVGRPLYGQSLAALGFWTHATFSAWTALTQFLGGPLPVWMISASIGANLLMIVPLICVVGNWHLTVRGRYHMLKENVVLRFVAFAAVAYIIATLERLVLGSHLVARFTEFTLVPVGLTRLFLLGFFGMAAFGSIYYIVPRITRVEWPSARAIRTHFGLTAGGIVLVYLGLTVGGLLQGVKLNNPSLDFVSAVRIVVPFVGVSTLGLLLILVGQIALATNFAKLLRKVCADCCPTCCSWAGGRFSKAEAKL